MKDLAETSPSDRRWETQETYSNYPLPAVSEVNGWELGDEFGYNANSQLPEFKKFQNIKLIVDTVPRTLRIWAPECIVYSFGSALQREMDLLMDGGPFTGWVWNEERK